MPMKNSSTPPRIRVQEGLLWTSLDLDRDDAPDDQVAARRAVERIWRRRQVEVRAHDAPGDVAQRRIRRPTEVHLADRPAELVSDGRHRVLGHGVDRLRE